MNWPHTFRRKNRTARLGLHIRPCKWARDNWISVAHDSWMLCALRMRYGKIGGAGPKVRRISSDLYSSRTGKGQHRRSFVKASRIWLRCQKYWLTAAAFENKWLSQLSRSWIRHLRQLQTNSQGINSRKLSSEMKQAFRDSVLSQRLSYLVRGIIWEKLFLLRLEEISHFTCVT